MLSSAPQWQLNCSFSIINLGLNHSRTYKADIVGRNSETREWSYQTDRQESSLLLGAFQNNLAFFPLKEIHWVKTTGICLNLQAQIREQQKSPSSLCQVNEMHTQIKQTKLWKSLVYIIHRLNASVRMLIVLVGCYGVRKSIGERIEVLHFRNCLSNNNRDLWFLTWEGL